MTEFTPLSAIFGGILIGLAAIILLLGNGRVMGVSGILSGALSPSRSGWHFAFLLGLMLGPALINWANIESWQISLPSQVSLSWWQVVLGGVLVGVGTRLGAGCTSGHGVCGIGRLSERSIVATCCFMLVAIITVFLMRHVL